MVEPEESGGGQVGQGGAQRARRETEQPKVPASGSSGIAPGSGNKGKVELRRAHWLLSGSER